MQANISIGFVEVSSIAQGILASDAMAKTADVKLNKTAVLARGKYLIMITGATGEVESAMRSGRAIAGNTLVHDFIVRNVHKQVLEALDKRLPKESLEAVGIIETKDAAAAVHAADEAAKAAAVELIEVRSVVPGGKGLVTLTGEPGAVRSAIAAGIQVVPQGQLVSHVVIPMAHPQLVGTIAK
jgi:microcompartment protein CcmL/EutN